MRILKIMLVFLVLCVASTFSISCGSGSDAIAVTEDRVETVQRGDLTVDITAVGNLALSLTEDLTFEISGTVEGVSVEEGVNRRDEYQRNQGGRGETPDD